MNTDFQVFQYKILSSLTPNVPLQDNLCAVMAPALHKLKRFCRAKAAIHVFPSPEGHEWHVLVVGSGAGTHAALLQELKRRHDRKGGFLPNPHLPRYQHLKWKDKQPATDILKAAGEDYLEKLKGNLLVRLGDVAESHPDEFTVQTPRSGDFVIVIPLRSETYPHLGYFFLWGLSDELKAVFHDSRNREGRLAFRKMMESLIVSIVANFYRLDPSTYLPSSYQTNSKKVTLLCAVVRDFDRLANILRQRHDLDADTKTMCLRKLVNRFNETTTHLVDRYHGRVDQTWGSGIIAVFGEYLDTPDASRRSSCKRALAMAADLVTEFRTVIAEWLERDFCLEEYEEQENAFIGISPAVAIDHGELCR
ncbi:MAG: hypothetical protein NTY01_08135 [Verrucomicrobia bacterium]|nr:hypothetical protein [Verrucomicrobiota bacterium]